MAGFDTVWNLFAPYLPALVIVVFTIIFAWLVNLVIGRLVQQSSTQMAGAAR